jgi:hypothetical protein
MIDMVTIIIAIASLFFSVFSFIFFEVKIKKQEQILNDYKIAEYEEAERDKLYAHLSINTYWRDKDTLYLVVENHGPSDAFNVCIKDLNKESFLFRDLDSSFPIETIYSGDKVQLRLLVYSDMPENTRIQVAWEDDSKETHTEKEVIHIHG